MGADLTKISGADKEALIAYIDTLREAVLLFDDEGNIIYANLSCIALFGYEFKQVISFKPEDLFNSNLCSQLRRYFETGHFSNLEHKKFYGRAIRVNNTSIPIELSLTIYFVEKQNFILVTLKKGTDPKADTDSTRLERAFFEQLFETIPEAIAILDEGHNLLRVNTAFSVLFGYENDDVTGKPIDKLITRGDVTEQAMELTGKVVAGEQVAVETVRYHRDGHPINVSILGTPIMLKGVQIGAVGIYRNITKRKNTENKIRILARFPSESPDPILRVSDQGEILYANKAAHPLMTHWAVETHHDLPEDLIEIVKKTLFKGDRIEIELNLGDMTYSLRFSPVPWENYVNIYGVDISERKKAEQEIAILARFPSENPDPVLRIDKSGVILYVNIAGKKLANLWDCKVGERVPDDIARTIDKVFESGQLTDIEVPCGDKYFSLRFSPVYEADYVNLYGLDITEKKAFEEEQKKLRDQLIRAERMESLGLLAGGVAHDLNNVLGPLVAYPELIKMQLSAESPIRDRIDKIENSALRAAEMVQDLLTMARRGKYEMAPVDLNKIISSYLNSTEFENLTKSDPDVKILFEPKDEFARIYGSSSHLNKVIMNLVINACDAMPSGGELKITTESRNIDRLVGGFDSIEAGKYIILKVKDSGIGIDPKDIKRLFEPFYSKKEMGRSGSGLGLSIVYGVIKDHNGYIDVISRPNQGTKFSIYLPEYTGEEKGQEDPERPPDIRGHEKILIIDDLEEQRELAATVLSSLGYKVEVAENGRTALAMLQEEKFDLIVIDMIMEEDFDGFDTYREALKINPGQKALIVSGYSETERVRMAEKLGANGYVKKPYTMQKLGKAIRDILDKKSGA